MKKTSLYLQEADVDRLRRLAERAGRSQAEIVRTAIAAYEAHLKADSNFALAGAWEGDGTSVADMPEQELLKGFGR
ncbi:MAG: CopG family transcriptional regulator [Candidatus Dormibacteraeota bacterium]|uniref:CopG family transcriptional regulator n=1 Tax=Candidatus Dormiibacter inghamiae TaxID=3127013 RepID=A0A934KF03_9BACT|nr:CopG family transcriptional regulator [Candidatus Dormibacteraeota bacterium]MBJ7604791.1 CopG family transcriptional regulator [Candidatus Dormibacteraeota bacterium]